MSEDKEKKLPEEIVGEEEILSENRDKARHDIRKAISENEKTDPAKKENIAGD